MLPHSLQSKGGPRALPMDFPPTGATTFPEGSSQPCLEQLPGKCILSSTQLPDPGQGNLWLQGVKHSIENGKCCTQIEQVMLSTSSCDNHLSAFQSLSGTGVISVVSFLAWCCLCVCCRAAIQGDGCRPWSALWKYF